jgi:hypothetical protein
MLAICREKLARAGIPECRARIQVDDIANVSLDRAFDLITAPFRVFQNLETDAEIDGFFETVRKHLCPGGRCILNVFKPNREPDALRTEWVTPGEYECWEMVDGGERVTCHGRNVRMDPDEMILYPELVYRRYRDRDLLEEAVLKIVMRAYYPDEFAQLIAGHGFEILERWGGYGGEAYGEGPELVIEFGEAR